MTTSMIECVARAFCLRCHNDPDSTHGGSWDGGSLPKGAPAWTVWVDDARAALQAIRIPDDHAIAAVEAWARTSKTDRTWAEGFTVMVDAMLGETGGSDVT